MEPSIFAICINLMFALDSVQNAIQPFSLLLQNYKALPQKGKKMKKSSLQVVNLPFFHIDRHFQISVGGQLTNLLKYH